MRIIISVCLFSLKGLTSTPINENSIVDIGPQENFATLFNEDVLYKTVRDNNFLKSYCENVQ